MQKLKPSIILLAVFLLLLPVRPTSASITAGDPLVIDVLFISRFIGPQTGKIFDRMLAADPSITLTRVVMPGHSWIGTIGANPELMNRRMRMYMPRSYQQLVTKYDMVLLYEAPCGSFEYRQVFFDPKWMSWFIDAVRNKGTALEMWGGDASWGGGGEGMYYSWGDTILDTILPFESFPGYNPPHAAIFHPLFVQKDNPLSRLPWKEAGPIELLNKVEPKMGSKIIAKAVSTTAEYPWMAWWRQGRGKVFGDAQVFFSRGTIDRMYREWEWFPDFLVYKVYFGVGKKIPLDLMKVHLLRREINTYLDRVSLLVSLIEFTDSLGANTQGLYRDLDAINSKEKEAETFYRRDEYDKCGATFNEIGNAMDALEARAIRVKKATLLWIYMIEWLSVSGTSLIAGVLIWLLMIRRRFYKEAKTTRVVLTST